MTGLDTEARTALVALLRDGLECVMTMTPGEQEATNALETYEQIDLVAQAFADTTAERLLKPLLANGTVSPLELMRMQQLRKWPAAGTVAGDQGGTR